MARRDNVRGNGRTAGKSKVWSIFGKIFSASVRQTLFALLCIGVGGVLFNLDRLGETEVLLLKYKQFLPRVITRFMPGAGAQEGSATPNQELAGRIIEVYDGDTATLLTKENMKYKIRFYGIDAPEAAQEGGIDSRDALREKILGKEVTVNVVSTDRYGRAVGRVMIGGRNINQEMIAEGRAWYYKAYASGEYEFARAEDRARRKSLGLWKSASPMPPWEWRRKYKRD